MEKTMEISNDVLEKISCVEYRTDPNIRTIRSYSLRAQKLGTEQIKALNEHVEEYVVFFENKFIDLNFIFGNDNKVIVEIGFGNGERLLDAALNFPDYNFLGIEVYINGFSRLLYEISERKLKNIKIMRFDAKDVLKYMIKNDCLYGIEIFFPDPWPKKRHKKKRLVNEDFINIISEKLVEYGYFRMVTDSEEYALSVKKILDLDKSFSDLNLLVLLNDNKKFTNVKQIINHTLVTKYNLKAKAENRVINSIIRLKI